MDHEHLVFVNQLLDGRHSQIGLADVVFANITQLAPVNPSGRVHFIIDCLDAIVDRLAVHVERPGQYAERANQYLIVGDTDGLRLRRGAQRERCNDGDRG